MKLPNLESRSAPALETIAQLPKRLWNVGESFSKCFSLGNTLVLELRVWKWDFSRQFWRLSRIIAGVRSLSFFVPKKRAWLRVKCFEDTFCWRSDCLSCEITLCLWEVSFSLRLTRVCCCPSWLWDRELSRGWSFEELVCTERLLCKINKLSV